MYLSKGLIALVQCRFNQALAFRVLDQKVLFDFSPVLLSAECWVRQLANLRLYSSSWLI
jgi:hypothetical protein